MRILQIFNPYVNYGGEESAVNQISAELEKEHELRNIIFDIHGWARRGGLLTRVRQLLQMAWNPASVRKVRDTIHSYKPDVILIHNIMPIGSAALYLYLSRCGLPVVQYIHNFRPFSVNGYCWGSGRILTEGLDLNFLPEVAAGGWQESRLKTAWYAVLIRVLHALGVYRRIAGWIAISRFMKEAFVSGGIEEGRIAVLPHSWEPTNPDTNLHAGQPEDPEFLFLGRISEEKGLQVLLDAWEMHEKSGGRGQLRIAGNGPLADEVAERCARMERAEYLGFRGGKDKEDLLASCRALIVPSVWWEPLGLVLYEAYDHAKPVLAARSGGIVDHVTDGVTGWVHVPGNASQLAAHIREVSENPEEARIRGRNGRESIESRNPERWITEISSFLGAVASRRIQAVEVELEPCPRPIHTLVYLADQNPGYDRSFGISRMTLVVLNALRKKAGIEIEAIVSKTSQQAPGAIGSVRCLPWGTRNKFIRLFTDHIHPLFSQRGRAADVFYYPKGYLPLLSEFCHPSVVTIHDTIIQYDEDHYPKWRKPTEYAYWAMMLKHTLREADAIMTVSKSSERQIRSFMDRHGIPQKEIAVTYEPCLYESLPQPAPSEKSDYVIHLASTEPHKQTATLVRWWLAAQGQGRDLPTLHLIGNVPEEVQPLLDGSSGIVRRPFLDDSELQEAYRNARALILPSEIEGFGLPALEAYYLGTPVCFVRHTSVEEVLAPATQKGGFLLEDPDSLFTALELVTAMDPEEIRNCGLKLRETYAAEKVADRMLGVFMELAGREKKLIPDGGR